MDFTVQPVNDNGLPAAFVTVLFNVAGLVQYGTLAAIAPWLVLVGQRNNSAIGR